MHELYSRYYLQHILWLKGRHHDYYVQPPAVHPHDIADVELKIIKDRERCLLWLDGCLAYEEDVNMLNLRTFLCDHSMHYLPVGRFDDHRVLSETADMLSDNRYAVVVRPKFMTSSTTVEQGAIFAHILGRKPGHVYAWGQGEFTQNAAAYAHPLTPGESAYLAHYNLAPVDPRALTDEQAREAQRLFGDGPEARTQYANWRSRARIINHYKFTHPATVEGLMLYYRVTRDTNPAWFALERGWQLGSGKEMFTGKPVSRTRAGLELLLGLGVIKLFGALAKAGRRAEAPKARPPKPAKGKGMAEVESPGKKAGDVDDGMQKKYIGNREGPKTAPPLDSRHAEVSQGIAKRIGKSSPAQTSGDLDQLFKQAKVADVELKKLTDDIASSTNGKAVYPPGLKTKARAIEKINADYGGDASKLLDISRSSISFESADDLYKALDKIDKKAEIVRIKDRFVKPAPGGYRDILVNIKQSNGHITELQLHSKQILDVKGGTGHKLYEQIREINGKAILENRPLDASELKLQNSLLKESETLYDSAFKGFLGK